MFIAHNPSLSRTCCCADGNVHLQRSLHRHGHGEQELNNRTWCCADGEVELRGCYTAMATAHMQPMHMARCRDSNHRAQLVLQTGRWMCRGAAPLWPQNTHWGWTPQLRVQHASATACCCADGEVDERGCYTAMATAHMLQPMRLLAADCLTSFEDMVYSCRRRGGCAGLLHGHGHGTHAGPGRCSTGARGQHGGVCTFLPGALPNSEKWILKITAACACHA